MKILRFGMLMLTCILLLSACSQQREAPSEDKNDAISRSMPTDASSDSPNHPSSASTSPSGTPYDNAGLPSASPTTNEEEILTEYSVVNVTGDTVATRILPPEGYRRM